MNLARAARGELAVSTLWLWGGGAPPLRGSARRARACRTSLALRLRSVSGWAWCASGARTHPLPQRLEDLLDTPARRAVMVVDLATQLAVAGRPMHAAALAALDAQWISPAVGLRCARRSCAPCMWSPTIAALHIRESIACGCGGGHAAGSRGIA